MIPEIFWSNNQFELKDQNKNFKLNASHCNWLMVNEMLRNLGRRTINLAAALRTDCRGGRRLGGLWEENSKSQSYNIQRHELLKTWWDDETDLEVTS